jgi:hypothetical protein
MKDQNCQLYADIKTAMAKSTAHKAMTAMWSHINAVHSLGREPKQYRVTEDDGLGLFWMMTMLYRPSDEAYRENLERGTYALCRKLSLQSKGNPTKSAFRRGGPANQCKRITSQHHTTKHERKVHNMYTI